MESDKTFGVNEPSLLPCEFRLKRPIAFAGPGAPQTEWVCLAAGGMHLSADEDTEPRERTCGACPVPKEMARRPCLYMVPVRIEEQGELKSYFLCRYFYRLDLQGSPTDTFWCGPCPYWFPRPPLHLILDHEKATSKMIHYIQVERHILRKPLFWWSRVEEAKTPSNWQRFLARVWAWLGIWI